MNQKRQLELQYVLQLTGEVAGAYDQPYQKGKYRVHPRDS